MRTERNRAGDHAETDAVAPTTGASRVLPIITVALAIAIFLPDVSTLPEVRFAVLYVGVVLLTAGFLAKRGFWLVASACGALAVLGLLLTPLGASPIVTVWNRLLSLAAIGVTALLAAQIRSREMALREQAGLLDLIHDTVFVREMNDVVTYWNRDAEERYGWKAREAVGKTTHRLLQTIFPVPLEEITAELLRTGRWEGELVHIRKDGTQAIVASRWSVRRDERGRPVAILETNNDITEQKRAEEALRASEAQWKAVFENNPTMYFMVDADGITLSVNAFGAEQLGYSRDELVGSPVLDVFYEPDREDVRGNVARCFAQLDQTLSWEARKVRKDGAVLWVRETARAVLLRNRPVILIACEDITERKQAEEAARRSEQELRDLIENLPALIFVALPGALNEFTSRRWHEYTGLFGDDATGSAWQSVMHPEDLERHLEKWRVCAATGEPYEDEARVRRAADGQYRWFLVRALPGRDDSGTIRKWYGVLTDIEDRKRTEEALHQAQAELARVTRVTTLGELTASIAHEVNQPIAAAVTSGQAALRWLTRETHDPAAARRAIERAIRDANRASAVIGGIRDLVRKAPPRNDRLDLNDAIREVIILSRSEVLRHGVSLQTRLAPGLPAVHGDRVQLQQVILNLVLNAVEAMSGSREGAREMLISTETEAANGVRVAVRDSGPAQRGDPPAVVRALLHDQAHRHGDGTVHLSLDHRGAWRTAVGDRKPAPGGAL